MITKERKRELKKMYVATQKTTAVKNELALFFAYFKGWIRSFPVKSENDVQLLKSIAYVIEQHNIDFDMTKEVEIQYTVKQMKDRLVQQHFELAKVLSMMSDCGLDNLPSWNPDTWIIAPVVNLYTDIGYVLDENDLQSIPL
ncbi:hypothetical protein A5819_003591 [Enterococcus sp. 7E2_DIV0204]|uniref:hypothetical protein n=1 Tax=unclassified Enterococcus TaxID=2608891 RepID=UPI000A358D68|nr:MULTISPECIES: hypothetical protein [unclassified Enterococcus]OTN84041.1 hypothetical protein A5819_003591 [Enterococcus sp. 7E2_DIV0204]OTP47176.1 hypothetical protein A5884_003551 [Enterococcus sp. 7D2_DIV0200]